jgi:hypothetical protein
VRHEYHEFGANLGYIANHVQKKKKKEGRKCGREEGREKKNKVIGIRQT